MHGHINFNLNINEFANLNYNEATIDPSVHKEYIAAGHHLDTMVLYNYFEPNPMPACVETVREHFSFLHPCSIAVNLCKPGQYLPLHSDFYKKWMQVFDIDDIDRIQRYIVMLEDSVPGQMLQIVDTVYSTWKQGDYFGWTGSTEHAIYNMSKVNRYALQVTGYA